MISGMTDTKTETEPPEGAHTTTIFVEQWGAGGGKPWAWEFTPKERRSFSPIVAR